MALAMTLEPTAEAAPVVTGPLRTCIVTGETMAPERMIRFVVGPDGDVVPDLARRLPGRGMWLAAERAIVEQAVAKKAFARAARAAVTAAPDLPQRIEKLLLDRALEDLSRARRAGRAVAGFVKVEQMIAQRRAGLLVVAHEADGDGLGKLQASGLPIERLGGVADLGGVFGRDQAVYVAVARDDASGAFIQRIASGAARWRRYRSNGAG
ncbi:MAG: RNA-binding protein [Reyranella sp.]|uniref:RNA-binding protein n=1 Tax=Reyranella sp. TaxID=1929291 RepID=UPI001ACAFC51|nr:RNA-binding protein [Reyranella sp.]MBN9087779.1 RNA-binding protein [Reyranella sp.]